MIKTMSRADEARQKALEALQDAYGRTQTTPDGLMCRMGRIDRAYQRKASANGNTVKYEAAIKAMQADTTAAFALADKLLATYQRLCKVEGIAATLDTPMCDCTYCQTGLTSAEMNNDDWQRFIEYFGATTGAN